MVEAIQADDIDTARQAHSQITRKLPASAYAPQTTLGKIGSMLDSGDLGGAQAELDALQTKALKVLRAVQEVAGAPAERKSDGASELESTAPGPTIRIII